MDSKYEREFSNWLKSMLPKSSEWINISDIDFLIQNYKTKKFLIIELKTKWNEMPFWQKSIYNMLHKRLVFSNKEDERNYMGMYLLQFSWNNWEDSIVYISWTWMKRKTQIFQMDFLTFLSEKLWIEENH